MTDNASAASCPAGYGYAASVMAGPAGQVQIVHAKFVRRGGDGVADHRGAGRGQGMADLAPGDSQALCLDAGADMLNEVRAKAAHRLIVARTDFQRHRDPPRHGIGGIRFDRDMADGGDQRLCMARGFPCGLAGGAEDVAGADQRILTQAHGGGAGMVGPPGHGPFLAPDADDIGHHANGDRGVFKDAALFDMHLKIGGGRVRSARR